jgi:Rhs element Vgr protein
VVDYLIKVEGTQLPSTVQVLSLVVTKEINRIPRAKITLIDGDTAQAKFTTSDESFFVPGKAIEIAVGFESDEQLIFKGIVVKHSIKIRANGRSQLFVECMDAAFLTTINRKSRYFTEVTDADAIEEILGAYQLTADIEPMEVSHDELVQFETTDWNFIVSRAEANGRLCFVSDGELNIKAPDFSTEPVLTLQFGATLLEFDAEMDARNQYPAVKAFSWDYSNQELLEVEAADPGFVEGGNIQASDLAAVGQIDSFDLRHSGQVVQEELQAWADACLLRSRMAKIRGRAKFQGFPGIKPGDMIQLQGVGERFNGKAFVSAIRHEIAGGNWTTDAQIGFSHQWYAEQMALSSAPAPGLVSGIRGLQLGVVTQLEGDPGGEHRILVKVPVISTQEDGIWARVATLDAGSGAGSGRGTFFLPEIDDEVVVGFVNDDPRDPVVMGMLHSSSKPAPIAATDDNHQKGYVSRSELKLLFDDEKKILSIETPAGKKIVLDEDGGMLLLEDENGNKIEMSSSGIVIESAGDLTLKAGGNLKAEGSTNLELKAGANFKAEGSAGAELSTSAIAVLKGSLVQIN